MPSTMASPTTAQRPYKVLVVLFLGGTLYLLGSLLQSSLFSSGITLPNDKVTLSKKDGLLRAPDEGILRQVVANGEKHEIDSHQPSSAGVRLPPDNLLSAPNKKVEDEQSHHDDDPDQFFFFAGLIDDGAEITHEAMQFVISLTCVYNVKAHILVRENHETLSQLAKLTKLKTYPSDQQQQQQHTNSHAECTKNNIHIGPQPDYISAIENRVERLQHAREYQRAVIQGMMTTVAGKEEEDQGSRGNAAGSGVVIMADLDLIEFPFPSDVVSHAHKMSTGETSIDVMCAAGVVENYSNNKNHNKEASEEEGYFDTFATILLPDTFVYPLQSRQNQVQHFGEDPGLIIGPMFSNVDLLDWFFQKGSGEDKAAVEGLTTSQESNTLLSAGGVGFLSPVPVRSCFGGLALYRVETFVRHECSYLALSSTPPPPNTTDANRSNNAYKNWQYANKHDQRPCEHVIFNRCLKDVDPTTTIAVQPDLRTRWQHPQKKETKSYAISKFPSLKKAFEMHRTKRAGSSTSRGIRSTQPSTSAGTTKKPTATVQESGIPSQLRPNSGDNSKTTATSVRGRGLTKQALSSWREPEEEDEEYWERKLEPMSYSSSKKEKSAKKEKSDKVKSAKKEDDDDEGNEEETAKSAKKEGKGTITVRKLLHPPEHGEIQDNPSQLRPNSGDNSKTTATSGRGRGLTKQALSSWREPEEEDEEYWERKLEPMSYSSSKKEKSAKKEKSDKVKSAKKEGKSTIPERKRRQLDHEGSEIRDNHQSPSKPIETKRPKAILHVGPRKTGTTSIQGNMGRYEGELRVDNFRTPVHFGDIHTFANCFLYKDEEEGVPGGRSLCEPSAKETIVPLSIRNFQLARDSQSNIFVSSEALDMTELVDPAKIRELIQADWDMHVVVVYRRFYSWMVSNFGEEYRRYGRGWNSWDQVQEEDVSSKWWQHTGRLSISTSLTKDVIDHWYRAYSAYNVNKFYQDENNFETTVINYEDSNDIAESLFCREDFGMRSTCNAIRIEKTVEGPAALSRRRENQGSVLAYDEIAMAAYYEGLIDASRISRPEAREAIQAYYEEGVTLGSRNIEELPKKCLSEELMALILELSLTDEKVLFPTFFASDRGESDLRFKFSKATTSEFCGVDTEKLLQDPSWRLLLSNLVGRTATSHEVV